MNLTINSLSLLSLYSFSPLLSQHSITFTKSNLKNFFPTIFYNYANLQLGNSVFYKGVGSLIYNYPLEISINSVKNEYYDTTYIGNNFTAIFLPENSSITKIVDCHFSNIYLTKNCFIGTTQVPHTFYMTSCVFYNIQVNDTLVYLFSKATKITHNCYSGISRISKAGHGALILFCRVIDESFGEFVYSSAVNCTDFQVRYKYNLYTFNSYSYNKGSFRFQCINTTKSKATKTLECYGVNCVTIQMNSFNPADSYWCFHFYNVLSSKCYIGMNNFHKCYYEYFLYMQYCNNYYVTVENCVFNNPSIYSINHFVNTEGNAVAYNCVFYNDLNWSNINRYTNCTITKSPISYNLAHFSTESICLGVMNENASGCNDRNCPKSIGCPINKFSIQNNDVFYTEKYHPGFNTVWVLTPSRSFTPSKRFTKSNLFSESIYFTKSQLFTNSNLFSSSTAFSTSFMFSVSNLFSSSAAFSTSLMFSVSNLFSSSTAFSTSFMFSLSNLFSKSDCFSNSFDFTKSRLFLNSCLFTRSDLFSSSFVFTRSIYFSFSFEFSDSNLFSQSNCFSLEKLNSFKNSIFFTESEKFLPTPTQSLHSQFISNSLSVSLSYVKVRSVNMTHTIIFGQTFVFTYINGSQIMYETNIFHKTQLYYIIYILSPTYIPVVISFEMNNTRKKITPENLIGIVCGSVSVFFLIIFIVITIYRKIRYVEIQSFDTFSSSYDQTQNDLIDQRNEIYIENVGDKNSIVQDLDLWI